MKVPVLIAAYNEPDIGDVLGRLPADAMDVIVVVNGEASDGATVRAAEPYGVRIVHQAEAGKVLAIQHVLRTFDQLGHDALGPILFLDADSYPLWPRSWARVMTNHVTRPGGPAAAAGLVCFHGPGRLSNLARFGKKFVDAAVSRVRHTNVAFGANMALRLGHRDHLDRLLGLPHIWRGEDRAMIDIVREAGGAYTQSLRPSSMVAQSSRYSTSLADRLRLGTEETARRRDAAYDSRAAPGARFYYDSTRSRVVPSTATAPVERSSSR